MKILTVLGARPQFIKASAVSRIIKKTPGIEEIIVHTGQHFDTAMSSVFFEELRIPSPRYNLGVANLSHGAMTGRMTESLERVIVDESPDYVMVFGDTNSTLAGALAAVKLGVPIAHVEAGLRSYNMQMPEEINRILADRVSTLLFCPTANALENLKKEGYPHPSTRNNNQQLENVGDVMLDVTLYYRDIAVDRIALSEFGLTEKNYILCTLHRQENTDDINKLSKIFSALKTISNTLRVVLPLHPRTRSRLAKESISLESSGLMVISPLSYLEMQRLEMGAAMIITDSGGIQKEAYFHQVPCITLRDETEWPETCVGGWNRLVGADPERIISALQSVESRDATTSQAFGAGDAATRIVRSIAISAAS
jgi:UDP-GlcNAc3NAcA epimerase